MRFGFIKRNVCSNDVKACRVSNEARRVNNACRVSNEVCRANNACRVLNEARRADGGVCRVDVCVTSSAPKTKRKWFK